MEFIKEGMIFNAHLPLVMGTKLDFLSVGAAQEVASSFWEWLCATAVRLDSALSYFDPRSEVFSFNESYDEAPVNVSDDLYALIIKSIDYFRRTGGLFDITRGRMSSLGVCSEGVISKSDPSLTIDFGGIAKGWLMSLAKEKLASEGIRTAFVNFGDSAILAVGHHPFGECWKVGVQNPFCGGVLTEMCLVDCALSTSGNTPGNKGHIINPLTGERNYERKITCVKSPDPLEAEVLSTVLMMADEKRCEALKKEFPSAEMKIFYL